MRKQHNSSSHGSGGQKTETEVSAGPSAGHKGEAGRGGSTALSWLLVASGLPWPADGLPGPSHPLATMHACLCPNVPFDMDTVMLGYGHSRDLILTHSSPKTFFFFPFFFLQRLFLHKVPSTGSIELDSGILWWGTQFNPFVHSAPRRPEGKILRVGENWQGKILLHILSKLSGLYSHHHHELNACGVRGTRPTHTPGSSAAGRLSCFTGEQHSSQLEE